MEGINERIKKVRSALGISQLDFSKKIYISQTHYSDIESGNRNLNERLIQLISTKFNVNKDWLKTGEQDMFADNPPDVYLEELIDIYNAIDEPLRKCLLEQAKSLLKVYTRKN